jgi:hypothetical protein
MEMPNNSNVDAVELGVSALGFSKNQNSEKKKPKSSKKNKRKSLASSERFVCARNSKKLVKHQHRAHPRHLRPLPWGPCRRSGQRTSSPTMKKKEEILLQIENRGTFSTN